MPALIPDSVAYTTDAGAAGEFPGSPGCEVRWIADELDR